MSHTQIMTYATDFFDPGPLVDGDLELILPDSRWFDDMLYSCHHPRTEREMPAQGRITREHLIDFLRDNPRGFTRGDPAAHLVPAYTFWMRLDPRTRPFVPIAGAIGVRLGTNENLELYLGHIGYHVFPPARGRRYAERACRLILPLARSFGMKTLWITTNPDNIASRRTCERLGATFIDTVAVPADNALYTQGDRFKRRYRMELGEEGSR